MKGKNKHFAQLGYHFSIWNGGDDTTSLRISFTCNSTSLNTPNNVNFNLPKIGKERPDLVNYDTLFNISKGLIKIWEPDQLKVTSNCIDEKVTFNGPLLEIGWISYFSKEYQKNNLV